MTPTWLSLSTTVLFLVLIYEYHSLGFTLRVSSLHLLLILSCWCPGTSSGWSTHFGKVISFPTRSAFVMSRVHRENFSKFTNWTGACNMSHATSSWTNRRSAEQDGLVVLRWYFWLMVYGFVTGCVQQVNCSQQDFADGVGRVQQLLTGYLLSAMLRLAKVGGPGGTGLQKGNDRSLRPILRLKVTNAHGRITASPSSSICSHRAVRHIALNSAWPKWTPQMFCLRTTWTHGINNISTQCNVTLPDPVIMPDATTMDWGGMV